MSAAVKNRRQGEKSKAFAGVLLPAQRLQACGHVFNSAGSPVCPYCERRPAALAPWPREWTVMDEAHGRAVLERWAAGLRDWVRSARNHAEQQALFNQLSAYEVSASESGARYALTWRDLPLGEASRDEAANLLALLRGLTAEAAR